MDVAMDIGSDMAVSMNWRSFTGRPRACFNGFGGDFMAISLHWRSLSWVPSQ